MSTIEQIDFYWRPGCPFCMGLERDLDAAGVPMTKLNIWEDADHAAFVRSVADGNETVPTVRIGEISLVNPSPAQVIEAMRTQTPHLVPDGE